MIEFLLVSIALRFLLFEHHSSKWFRFLLGRILAPGYWQALESCAYCNGFWVSAVSYLVVFEVPHQLAECCQLVIFGVVGAWVNYFVQLLLNIIENDSSNKLK